MPPKGQSPSEKAYHQRKWYCVYVKDVAGVTFHIECERVDEACALKEEYQNKHITARVWINVCYQRYANLGYNPISLGPIEDEIITWREEQPMPDEGEAILA